MKFARFTSFLMIFASAILFSSCEKEGVGGKNTLNIFVNHHNQAIPHAVVYIKYGQKEFPGEESNNYDQNITCDSNGEAKIENLRKGHYYLYSRGYDESIEMAVTGGVPVEIRQKSGEKSVNLPVTEEH
ncbi:MAG: hypothetical protein H0X62_08275 [Bacteroidetes bacterium]|nr:hypothetical protein [Bacteroidota bacterium]